MELPRGLTPAELAGGFGFPDARPLTSRIEESFVQRVESLPARDAAPPPDGCGRAGAVARGDRVRDVPRARRAVALLDAAQRLDPLDGALARATYLEAIASAMFAGRLGTGPDDGGSRGCPAS